MNKSPITPDALASSVLAVPPLARDANGSIDVGQNRRLMRHIEAGGVSTLLYGGNANLYHIAVSEYRTLLEIVAENAAKDTLVIPSVGPAYGTMLDQAAILRDFDFPTAMVLPTRDIVTHVGQQSAIADVVRVLDRPIVLYLKHDGVTSVRTVERLVKDGMVAAIKYAVVRDKPTQDDYLQAIVDAVGPHRIISGIGEQPAIIHLRDFGLAGFTSGCVCVAPALSMRMLRAIQDQDFTNAESIRSVFRPLEDLRNQISPIRVLHAAVGLAGIAETGPLQPMLDVITDASQLDGIRLAAQFLLEQNADVVSA